MKKGLIVLGIVFLTFIIVEVFVIQFTSAVIIIKQPLSDKIILSGDILQI